MTIAAARVIRKRWCRNKPKECFLGRKVENIDSDHVTADPEISGMTEADEAAVAGESDFTFSGGDGINNHAGGKRDHHLITIACAAVGNSMAQIAAMTMAAPRNAARGVPNLRLSAIGTDQPLRPDQERQCHN